MSGIVMSRASGTVPARSRHKGTNRFHPVAIDAQFLGFDVMDLRQYRQTWVKGMIGRGSALETKAAQDVRSSGGRRFTGRSEFLRVITSRRTSLARFARASICEIHREYSMFPFGYWDRTLVVSMTAWARDLGRIADCIWAHSIKSFSFNVVMSCSIESSRAASGVMIEVDIGKHATFLGWRPAPNRHDQDVF